MRDVVFAVKDNPDRRELQYALRSLAMFPHGRVFLLGTRPLDWLKNVEYLPWKQQGNKWFDLDRKFQALATFDDLSDEVIYTEDDYFVIRRVLDFPNYTHPDRLPVRVKRADDTNAYGGWSNSLRDTCRVLQEHGVENPESFDVHIPMVVVRAEIPLYMACDVPLRWRSLYGNVSSRPAVPVKRDVKHTTREELELGLRDTPAFLSSNERTFDSSGVHNILKKRFPRKSQYEV